jgi:hypothetical protein
MPQGELTGPLVDGHGGLADGDCQAYRFLVLRAECSLAGPPGGPHLVPQPTGYQMPVATAHEPLWINLMTATRDLAAAGVLL